MAAQSPSYASGIQNVSPPLGFVEIDGPGPQDTRFQVGGGTFVLNGATPVTVAVGTGTGLNNAPAGVTATSMIFMALKTVGGTVGAIPAVQTITPGTGFTVAGTASDTSTYSYLIIG